MSNLPPHKGLQFGIQNVNEQFVSSFKTASDFVAWGLKNWAHLEHLTTRTDEQRRTYLTEMYDAACAMTGKAKEAKTK